jgi:hypothetical protein
MIAPATPPARNAHKAPVHSALVVPTGCIVNSPTKPCVADRGMPNNTNIQQSANIPSVANAPVEVQRIASARPAAGLESVISKLPIKLCVNDNGLHSRDLGSESTYDFVARIRSNGMVANTVKLLATTYAA